MLLDAVGTCRIYCNRRVTRQCKARASLSTMRLTQERPRHHARECLVVIGSQIASMLQQVVHGLYVEALLNLGIRCQENVTPYRCQQESGPSYAERSSI